MRRALTLAVVSLVLAITASTPAWAVTYLQVSSDGRTWTSVLTEPLFDPDIRWVPGDQREASFFVRNVGPTAGDLDLDVSSARFLKSQQQTSGSTTDAQGLRDDGVVISTRVDDGPWLDLGAQAQGLGSVTVERGQSVRVAIRVVFQDSSTNLLQDRDLGLTFAARLSQSAAAQAGALPETGAAVSWFWAAAALLLLLVGSRLARSPEKDPS